MPPLYTSASRALQDQFDTRRLADRLEEVKVHDRFTPADRELIERLDMFFLATVDATGPAHVLVQGRRPRLRHGCR
jgi:predicted pyridoxine 5'-phosphate oxidase superfamily flavin-nucleotide-binding protein